MKLSRFHKDRGDEVAFAYGCDSKILEKPSMFPRGVLWDRVYITTLFSYMWEETIETVEFYKEAVGHSRTKIFIGGVMASLMPEDIFEETGIYPVVGVLNSPEQIQLGGNINIDELPPDYDLLDRDLYAINETFFAYSSRGCVNRCPWCGVSRIEPKFIPYIDIKPIIIGLRKRYGDKPVLKLMDNNVLASPRLPQIVLDLVRLGYGRNSYTDTHPPRKWVVDFNQGLDARYMTEEKMKLLSQVNISPMRIAFDRLSDRKHYLRAIKLGKNHGVTEFSNYLLFNFHDTPRDLYERLRVNIELNNKWYRRKRKERASVIYSYPMRYAPIDEKDGIHANRKRDNIVANPGHQEDLLANATWNLRFIRNVGVMCGAAHGAISPTPGLALRAIGETYEEFIANLYMPEALLRNWNMYERRIYPFEPKRKRGSGEIEAFRKFVLKRLKAPTEEFRRFHMVIGQNRKKAIREYAAKCKDREINKWLKYYTEK
jgi:hypothetical protein